MTVTGLTEVLRHESPLSYRRSYSALASLALPTGRSVDTKVEFTLEQPAIGDIQIVARVVEPLDYPLVPVIRALRAFVRELERRGDLP